MQNHRIGARRELEIDHIGVAAELRGVEVARGIVDKGRNAIGGDVRALPIHVDLHQGQKAGLVVQVVEVARAKRRESQE